MRVLDAGLAEHLAGSQTTLASCWRITRRDGLVLGFTDHDLALSFGGIQFVPAHGLDGGEAPARLGAGVDTSEVLGVLHADAISEDDILLGRFDGAEVETWRVNWTAPEQRVLLRRDTIGEIVREDGVFRAELRSPQSGLNRTVGRIYGGLCDAELGDGRCGMALDVPAFRTEGTVLGIEDANRLAIAGIEGFAEGWFAFGTVRWSGGARMDLRDRVVSHARVGSTDVLGFSAPVGEWVAVGQALELWAGCDRRLSSCRDKFGNSVNFRGFPHIPGSDFVLRHPRSGDALDGRAVVR